MEVSDKLKRFLQNSGCPQLARGRLRVSCYQKRRKPFTDATALRGGASRLVLFTQAISALFSNKREPPPDKPVASQESGPVPL